MCRTYKHGIFLNTVFAWIAFVTFFLFYHVSLFPLAQLNWFLLFFLDPTCPLPLPSKTSKQTNPNILNHTWLWRGLILQRKTVDSRLDRVVDKGPSPGLFQCEGVINGILVACAFGNVVCVSMYTHALTQMYQRSEHQSKLPRGPVWAAFLCSFSVFCSFTEAVSMLQILYWQCALAKGSHCSMSPSQKLATSFVSMVLYWVDVPRYFS